MTCVSFLLLENVIHAWSCLTLYCIALHCVAFRFQLKIDRMLACDCPVVAAAVIFWAGNLLLIHEFMWSRTTTICPLTMFNIWFTLMPCWWGHSEWHLQEYIRLCYHVYWSQEALEQVLTGNFKAEIPLGLYHLNVCGISCKWTMFTFRPCCLHPELPALAFDLWPAGWQASSYPPNNSIVINSRLRLCLCATESLLATTASLMRIDGGEKF